MVALATAVAVACGGSDTGERGTGTAPEPVTGTEAVPGPSAGGPAEPGTAAAAGTVAAAPPADPASFRVRYDLAAHLARAELRQGDAQVVDFGVPGGA